MRAEWAPPEEAELFGCGSIMDHVPEGYKGVLLGTGMMRRGQRHDLRGAVILGLRGKLTAEGIGVDAPLGDFGLLCALYAGREHKEHEIGIIPHYIFRGVEYPWYTIDITADTETVIREADRCERIISSSLHGIILADALGIENKWEYSDRVYGRGFKFRDYASALGEDIEPDEWRLGNQERIAEIAMRLERTVKGLKGE